MRLNAHTNICMQTDLNLNQGSNILQGSLCLGWTDVLCQILTQKACCTAVEFCFWINMCCQSYIGPLSLLYTLVLKHMKQSLALCFQTEYQAGRVSPLLWPFTPQHRWLAGRFGTLFPHVQWHRWLILAIMNNEEIISMLDLRIMNNLTL